MSKTAVLLEEPKLEFRYGQFLEDPHDGLSLFGPFGIEVGAHPKNLSFGVIGTQKGIQSFVQWCRVARGPLYPGEGKNS
jgi:hypothetical protein